MSNLPILYLSQKTLDSLDITTQEVIDCMEHLIAGQAQGKVWHTPKSVILPGDGRYMMSTLSSADNPPYLAVKSVILNPRNTESGLPQINGLIMVLDSETGLPVAVVDGNWVTAVRTAGASAVAARKLARANSSVVAFIGCGVQAHSHLKLFGDMFPLKEVRAFGRGSANREALCQTAEASGYLGIPCETALQAVEGADIVVTSVTMTVKIDPFIDPRWLKPGVFVSSTDTAIPFMAEGMSVFDRIIIDDREQELAMENPMVAPSLISGDISELVSGKISGRSDDNERTAFVFRAVVLGDLALSGLALDKARESGKGQILE
jgi:ornithine cyclodeaminase/alanine dehydrogenase